MALSHLSKLSLPFFFYESSPSVNEFYSRFGGCDDDFLHTSPLSLRLQTHQPLHSSLLGNWILNPARLLPIGSFFHFSSLPPIQPFHITLYPSLPLSLYTIPALNLFHLPLSIYSSLNYIIMSDLSDSVAALHLGASDPPRRFSNRTQAISAQQTHNSLIVRPLHQSQNPSHLRSFLAEIWHIDNRQDIIIQDNNNLLVRFPNHHRMLHIYEEGTWTFRGWFLAVDKLSNSNSPQFLSSIQLWIKVLNVPPEYRNEDALREIGAIIGEANKFRIKQPTRSSPGEAWVRVTMDINTKLKFVTSMFFGNNEEPTHLQLVFDKLRHFCTICGSILHINLACDLAGDNPQVQNNIPGPDQEVPHVVNPIPLVPDLPEADPGYINPPVITNRQSALLPVPVRSMHAFRPSSSNLSLQGTRGLTNPAHSLHATSACHSLGPTGSIGDILLPPCNINMSDSHTSTCPFHGYIHPPALIHTTRNTLMAPFPHLSQGWNDNIPLSDNSSQDNSLSSNSSLQAIRTINNEAEEAFEAVLKRYRLQHNLFIRDNMGTPLTPTALNNILQAILNSSSPLTSPPVDSPYSTSGDHSPLPSISIEAATVTSPTSSVMSPTPIRVSAIPTSTIISPTLPVTISSALVPIVLSPKPLDTANEGRASRKRKAPDSSSSSEEPSPRRRRIVKPGPSCNLNISVTSSSSSGEVGTPKPPAAE